MKNFNEIIQGIIGLISISTPIILAIILNKQTKYHKQVNGRMRELIDTTAAANLLKGEKDNQAKTDAKKQRDK